MTVVFRGTKYAAIFTEHAKLQMALRSLDKTIVIDVIQTGEVKEKPVPNKYWVYKNIGRRKDGLVAIALAVEAPHLIVITAMVNWRPK